MTISSASSSGASSIQKVRVITDRDDPKKIAVLVRLKNATYRITTINVAGTSIDLTNPHFRDFAKNIGNFGHEILESLTGEIPENFKIDANKTQVSLYKKPNTTPTSKKSSRKASRAVSSPAVTSPLNPSVVNTLQSVERQAQKVMKGMESVRNVETRFHDKPSVMKRVATKVAAYLTIAVVSPFALIAIIGAKIAYAIKKAMASPEAKAMRAATKELQVKEAKAKFETLSKDAVPDKLQDASIVFSTTILASINNADKVNNVLAYKLKDLMIAGLERSGYDKEEIEAVMEPLVDKLVNLKPHFATDQALATFVEELTTGTLLATCISKKELHALVKESKLFVETPERKVEIMEADQAKWQKFVDANIFADLHTLGATEEIDYRQKNLEVIMAYRDVTNSPTYLALKDDPHNEFIKAVHSFAVSIQTKIGDEGSVLDAYYDFGQKMLEGKNIENLSYAEIVEIGHNAAMGGNLNADSYSSDFLLYRPTHLRLTRGSLVSQGGFRAEIGYALGSGPYDPNGELGNIPSLQGITHAEIVERGGDEPIGVKMYNCYGGSPTVGSKVAPETIAFMQAIRNNNKLPIAERDPKIPGGFVDINLQNIENTTGEGARSFLLHQLQEKFPGELVVMTLSHDSDFFHGKGKYAKDTWESAETFGKQVVEVYQNEACYRYVGREGTKEGAGMALPYGRETWIGDDTEEGVLHTIIEAANEHFADLGPTTDRAEIKDNRYAYQKFIYTLMDSYVEMRKLSDTPAHLVLKNGEWVEEKSLAKHKKCKEMKDRGAEASLETPVTRMHEADPTKKTMLAATAHSRALSVGDVTILAHRLHPILAFLKRVDIPKYQDQAKSFISRALGVTVNESRFEPAFSDPEVRRMQAIDAMDEEKGLEEPKQKGLWERITSVFTRAPKPPLSWEQIRDQTNWSPEEIDAIVIDGHDQLQDTPEVTEEIQTVVIGEPLVSPAAVQRSQEEKVIEIRNVIAELKKLGVFDITNQERMEILQNGYQKLLENIGEDDVLNGFRSDIVRAQSFTINNGSVIPSINPNSDVDVESDDKRKIEEGLNAIHAAVGEDNEWELALQAICTQATLGMISESIGSIFALTCFDLYRDGPILRYELDDIEEGSPSPVGIEVVKNTENGQIEHVKVSLDVALNVLDGATKTVVMKDAVHGKADFIVELNDNGNPVVKDLTSSITIDPSLEPPPIKLTVAPIGISKVGAPLLWNNRFVRLEILGDSDSEPFNAHIVMTTLTGEEVKSRKEVKIYKEQNPFDRGEQKSFAPLGDYQVEGDLFNELIRSVVQSESVKPESGVFQGTINGESGTLIEGFNIEIRSITPVNSNESFSGVVRFFKNGILCGEIEAGKITPFDPRKSQGILEGGYDVVHFQTAGGFGDFFIPRKPLRDFVDKFEKHNI